MTTKPSKALPDFSNLLNLALKGHVSDAVRVPRQSAGDLAFKLGVTATTVSNYLGGRTSPASEDKLGELLDSLSSLRVLPTETEAVATAKRALRERLIDAWRPDRNGARESPTEAAAFAPQAIVSVFDGPKPPELCANSPYLSGHSFLGRSDQLDFIDEWAQESATQPALLYEAIGGSGKSILAWTWLMRRSRLLRADWAGQIWYSFYEIGADTHDFLTRALSYVSAIPRHELMRLSRLDLAQALLQQLRARPWLLVLDGVERLLVPYQRFDAALDADGVGDGAADLPRQTEGGGAPAMMRNDDADIFRSLLMAAPSKILMTSRYVPRCLLNISNQPLEGLIVQRLPGLSTADAEALFRACGIFGESKAIRAYLRENCDCHPLVIGFLAGLINRSLAEPGDFSAWVVSGTGGLALNLATAPLLQKRNHILSEAILSLPPGSRGLLSTLSMLFGGTKYSELVELMRSARTPEKFRNFSWSHLERNASPEEPVESDLQAESQAITDLQAALDDLRSRGLLLFDARLRSVDLHPVVRRVVADGLSLAVRQRIGAGLIDYFSATAAKSPLEADCLQDLQPRTSTIKTLFAMGELRDAWQQLDGNLLLALEHNFEAYDLCLSFLRPFFGESWGRLSERSSGLPASRIYNAAGVLLGRLNRNDESLLAHERSLALDFEAGNWRSVGIELLNVEARLRQESRFALADKLLDRAGALGEVLTNDELTFVSGLQKMSFERSLGNIDKAMEIWHKIDPLGRAWKLNVYRPGEAELEEAFCRLDQGELAAERLRELDAIVDRSKQSRRVRRGLHQLGGRLHLRHGRYADAATSFQLAVDMARSAGFEDQESEVYLLLSRHLGGEKVNVRDDADRLSNERSRPDLLLAELWLALGDAQRAAWHAEAALNRFAAEGGQYEHCIAATRARRLQALART